MKTSSYEPTQPEPRGEHSVKISIETDPDGTRFVVVEPEVLPNVRPNDVIHFNVPRGFANLLSVEVHVPGNLHRRISVRDEKKVLDINLPANLNWQVTLRGGRQDNFYIAGDEKESLQISENPVRQEHPYKVYAHFEGSVETVTTRRDPRMIVE